MTTKKALIVRGGWDGHQPVETSESIIPFLVSNGYEVRVEESTAVYADRDYLPTADLVVQVNTMNVIEKDEVAGLIGAVRSGTGMAGWHGGIADSYRDNPDYLQLIGGQFAHHPTRAPRDQLNGQQDDYFVAHTINIVPAKAGHPIVAGIEDFDLTTEQYWVLSDSYNEVLATTTVAARDFDAWTRPVVSPAIWIRQWGLGRVFVATPGHGLDVLDDPHVRTIVERGMLWASR